MDKIEDIKALVGRVAKTVVILGAAIVALQEDVQDIKLRVKSLEKDKKP